MLDAGGAELPPERVGARLGIAVVGEKLAADELVEKRRDLVGGFGVRRELADKLGAGVLPPREERDRALAQREVLLQVSSPRCEGARPLRGAPSCSPGSGQAMPAASASS
jgi:hypothetical protein